MSKETLEESINLHVAELLADKLFEKLADKLEEQWKTVISELVATRKTSEQLKQTLSNTVEYLNRLENILSQHSTELERNREVFGKLSVIIDEALKSMGVGE